MSFERRLRAAGGQSITPAIGCVFALPEVLMAGVAGGAPPQAEPKAGDVAGGVPIERKATGPCDLCDAKLGDIDPTTGKPYEWHTKTVAGCDQHISLISDFSCKTNKVCVGGRSVLNYLLVSKTAIALTGRHALLELQAGRLQDMAVE